MSHLANREQLKQGVETLTTFVGHQLIPEVDRLRGLVADYGRELGSHVRQLDRLHERLERLERDARAVHEMTFIQRLRWALRAVHG